VIFRNPCDGSFQRGATTVYFLLFTLIAFGLLGMATDFGRLYLIQGELQTAADAAALAAATRLAGTTDALMQAGDQVTVSFDSTTGNDNRFNLRMNQIGVGGSGLVTSTQIDYFATVLDALGNINGGQSGAIDWSSGAYPKYVRVQISAQGPVTFFPIVNRAAATPPTIVASAVAGISSAICTACGIEAFAVEGIVIDGSDPVNYGFVPGAFYTLYLSPLQRNGPMAQAPLAGTLSSVRYAILNHIPSGPQDLDLDLSLFEFGAGGISSSAGLTPPGTISAGGAEVAYPSVRGSTSATVGQDILCGLDLRFAVDPSQNNVCNVTDGGQFAMLAPLFTADTDVGGGTYEDTTGLQNYATEYGGNFRRILTMAVIDASDALNVLNFRQFLIEPAPLGGVVVQGVNPNSATGAFRAQYIGMPVPLRCGGIGGVCAISAGVGRTVLH
jgi:hypothetical protein